MDSLTAKYDELSSTQIGTELSKNLPPKTRALVVSAVVGGGAVALAGMIQDGTTSLISGMMNKLKVNDEQSKNAARQFQLADETLKSQLLETTPRVLQEQVDLLKKLRNATEKRTEPTQTSPMGQSRTAVKTPTESTTTKVSIIETSPVCLPQPKKPRPKIGARTIELE